MNWNLPLATVEEERKFIQDDQDWEAAQNQQEALNWFDDQFTKKHPEACISVSYFDDGRGWKPTTKLFVTEKQLQDWLKGQEDGAWDAMCQGYGSGSLEHFQIKIERPGQCLEVYRQPHHA